MSSEAYSRALGGIEGVELWKEIAADAYAGMNIFSRTQWEGSMEALGTLAATLTEEQLSSQTQEAMQNRTGPPQAQKTADQGEPGGGRFSVERMSDIELAYEGRSLSEDSEIYSYDFLTRLPDMKVTTLPDVGAVRTTEGKVDTRRVVDLGMKNARVVGTERDGKVCGVDTQGSNCLLPGRAFAMG